MATKRTNRRTNKITEGAFRASFKKTVGSVSYLTGLVVEGISITNKILPDESIGYSAKLSVKDQIKTSYRKGRNDLNQLVEGWLED